MNKHVSRYSLKGLKSVLSLLLKNTAMIPEDWLPQDTTYDLLRHVSKTVFVSRFKEVVQQITESQLTDPEAIKTLLEKCGHPYDYARLGHPFSTLFELLLQELTGVKDVFTFASKTKPFLAVIETRQSPEDPITIYCDGVLPISEDRKEVLRAQNVLLFERWSGLIPDSEPGETTVYVGTGGFSKELGEIHADAICCAVNEGGVLLLKTARIDPKEIQIIRKRTVAALLAGNCIAELQQLLDIRSEELPQPNLESECRRQMATIYSGVSADNMAYFCTGLAAETAVFTVTAEFLSQERPVRFYYAQNGYGGTGQLIGEILAKSKCLEPRPLAVLGKHEQGHTLTIVDYLRDDLGRDTEAPAMVFLETPTNPELQMHDFKQLISMLKAYRQQSGLTVPVIVDTTMAPLYQLFQQSFVQDWPFLIVKSGSKYFTKGKATLGVSFCGDNALAKNLLERARDYGQYTDSLAKTAQLKALSQGLQDLQPRMAKIAENTSKIAGHMQAEMRRLGLDFTCYAMTEAQVNAGLASGIISFYLPPAETVSGIDLVDEFVAFMLEHASEGVKNRVSYGQSSGAGKPDYIYIINPQESTQGSLSDAVKEAQKKDNVQICRVSVPVNCDVAKFNGVLTQYFDFKYALNQNVHL